MPKRKLDDSNTAEENGEPAPKRGFIYELNSPEKCLLLSDEDAKKLWKTAQFEVRNAVVFFFRNAYGEILVGGPGCQVARDPGPQLDNLYQRVFGGPAWFDRYLQLESIMANWPVLESLIGVAIHEFIWKPPKTYPEITLDLREWKTIASDIEFASYITTTDLNLILERRTRRRLDEYDFMPEVRRLNREICTTLKEHIETMKLPILKDHACSYTDLLQGLLQDAVLAAVKLKAKWTMSCHSFKFFWKLAGSKSTKPQEDGTSKVEEVWVTTFPGAKMSRSGEKLRRLTEPKYTSGKELL